MQPIQRRSDLHSCKRLTGVTGTVVVDPTETPYIIATISGSATFKIAPPPKTGYDDGATFKLYIFGVSTTNVATIKTNATFNNELTVSATTSNFVTGLFNKADNSWTITTGAASTLAA